MGKKDKKKGKGAEKTAAKTEKKQSSKIKKELAAKGEEDIESILSKIVADEKRKSEIIEDLVPPPSKRTSFTLTPHPDKDQLILYGGEYFNGTKTLVYNDLFFYTIKQDRWIKLTSPGGPPPRSAHQTVALSQAGGQLWVFGGEFTSTTQSQFYHYKDLWVFYFKTKQWEKINAVGGPSSRSGHRMVAVKKQLIVFGGFHDNTREFKYFNDIYSFNLENYEWKKLECSGNGPCPRSACQMTAISDGRILIYGGYSKEKVKKDAEKGVTHNDIHILAPDKNDTTGLKWKWQSVKQSGVRPSPRCGFIMAPSGNDRAVAFGGVYDEEDEEEELEGVFYNDLFQLDLTKTIWHEVVVTGKKDIEKKSRRKKKADGEEGEESEDEEEQNEVEAMENMKVEDNGEKVVSDDGAFTVTIGPSASTQGASDSANASKGVDVFVPPPRINCGMAVKRGVLYMYGGMYEDGDKQLTLNDFYSLDLNKLEEWQTIIPLKPEDLEWFDSDSESDSEMDDDDDDDDDDDEDDDNDNEDDDDEMDEMD